jgi:hypothetical protein
LEFVKPTLVDGRRGISTEEADERIGISFMRPDIYADPRIHALIQGMKFPEN